MKLTLLSGAALVAFASSAQAQTAASPFAGPYIGAQIGVAQLDDRHDDLDYWYDNIGGGLDSDRAYSFGARVGYDHVSGSLLVGGLIEGSLGQLNAFGDASIEEDYAVGTRLKRLGSIRGKLGVTQGRLAAYGTAGLALSNAKHRFREQDGSDETFDAKADRSGYVLGLGAAYALNARSNIALDYSHYEFGSDTNEILEDDGEGTDYFIRQDYKVRALMLSYNYGFGRAAGPVGGVAAAAFGGPYVGVQGSLAQLDSDWRDDDFWYDGTTKSRNSDRGGMIGLRAGYDIAYGNIVAGALAEVSFGKVNTRDEAFADNDDPTYVIGTKLSRLGSLRGKLGVGSGNLAAFATAGIAFSNAKQRGRDVDGSSETWGGKGDRTGYVLGLGGSWLMGNSSIGVDYSHYEFGKKSHEVIDEDGDPLGYFFDQDYKVRTLTLSYSYGF